MKARPRCGLPIAGALELPDAFRFTNMLMERASETLRLRAPQRDGETLVEPPLSSLPDVVARNRRRLAEISYDVQGMPLAELASNARRSLLRQAIDYTSEYRDVPTLVRGIDSLENTPFILSGHQPQLFHPGVWYKNFVLGSLASRMRGVGIHLLIDSDLCRGASIRVPTGTPFQPRLDVVPFDAPDAEVPYEERQIRDFATLASFPNRVEELILPLVADPIVGSLWRLTMDRNQKEKNLGLRLAQGRHALESEWHNQTLELPQSVVCQLPEFAWFVAHLLAHLPRFWAAYNDALADYRRLHRQRSHAHPVPDLTEFDGWLEAPFWLWTADDPQRRPLFARQSGDELTITDRNAHTIQLSLSADGEAGKAVDQLVAVASRGVKIRTRALTTTLFARLILSDLFLHGIGGAKYDQVTDQIARSFFGFALPDFAAVSATLRLPIAGMRENQGTNPSCTAALRELRFHPERYLDENGSAAGEMAHVEELLAAKHRWIQLAKTPENAAVRHRGIADVNELLQPYVAHRRVEIERRCDAFQRQARADSILRSRDYAFCLYSRRRIESLLADLTESL